MLFVPHLSLLFIVSYHYYYYYYYYYSVFIVSFALYFLSPIATYPINSIFLTWFP
jgi:hypothetical protein